MSEIFPAAYFLSYDANRVFHPQDVEFLKKVLRPCVRMPQVLDLGCGAGWLTGHLKDIGCSVTGIDISEEALSVAKAAVPGAKFELADFCSFSHATRYDAAIFWNTTLGIGERQLIGKALKNSVIHLKEGGFVIADLPNAYRVLPKYQESEVLDYGGYTIIDLNSFDPIRSKMQKRRRILFRGGLVAKQEYEILLLTPLEWIREFEAAGLVDIRPLSDSWSDFKLESRRLRLVASKSTDL